VFRGFDARLVEGLERGQVLRCRSCTARAVDLAAPAAGPFVVEMADGGAFHLDDALDAARLWRTFLHAEVFGR
jgi:hypothetical protein